MSVRQSALVVLLVAVGAAIVIAPATGATTGGAAASSDAAFAANETNESSDGNVSLGTQISSFMQASSAATNGSVDAGMWQAEFNTSNGSARDKVVENRIRTLDRRLDRLNDRMATIEAKHENGSLPEVAYMAQASQLNAKIESLQSALNDTDSAARSVGVNDTRLDRLRNEARNMSGREVAAVARSIPAVNPPGLGNRGPPEDVGPSDDAGPPEDAGNAGEPGRPDEVGNSGAPGQAGNATDGPANQGTNRTEQGNGSVGPSDGGNAPGRNDQAGDGQNTSEYNTTDVDNESTEYDSGTSNGDDADDTEGGTGSDTSESGSGGGSEAGERDTGQSRGR